MNHYYESNQPIERKMTTGKYIPAMGYDWLTPFYDVVARLLRLGKLKQQLLVYSEIRSDNRVLDIGCGTGTFLEMAAGAHPGAVLFGLDGDAKILQIAKEKARKKNLDIQLDHGMSHELPYPDAFFDRVVSSLVFHHLTTEDKRRTFSEILRVLRPGGRMVIADFGPPVGFLPKLISRLFKRFERVSENLDGLLPAFANEAGFPGVETLSHANSVFATTWIFCATKPG